ncbi:MAG: hypothetical protein CVU09_00830 [Bacteroidetes bacterium HGW-Bacteroidetes-4]|nr:MAG: hypothetical protein CVU09_00830 [Bacteroidetes bacterium HGW-Bacteroidetes-4]
MIQIHRDFESIAKWHSQSVMSNFNLANLINGHIINNGTIEDNFLIFLSQNLEDVLSLHPILLEKQIISKANSILGNQYFTEKANRPNTPGRKPRLNKVFIELLNSIFDYEKFCSYGTGYNAHCLTEKLEIKVCPYCNRNYISTLKPNKSIAIGNQGGTRPTLDHFYLKSDYPYLALSFWNLIPSCFSCNTQFRNTKHFDIFNNIHPYLNGFENFLYFQTDIIDITEFIGNSNKIFELELKENGKTIQNSFKLEKTKKNNLVFRLEEIYSQNHKSDVREIIQKAIIYDDKYSKSLYDNWSGIFTDEYDAQKMMLGNYTNIKDFEKRPLSKLTRDIANELGLI